MRYIENLFHKFVIFIFLKSSDFEGYNFFHMHVTYIKTNVVIAKQYMNE